MRTRWPAIIFSFVMLLPGAASAAGAPEIAPPPIKDVARTQQPLGCPTVRPITNIWATADPVQRQRQRVQIKMALETDGAIVRLDQDVNLDFPDLPAKFFPLRFGRCVTLTSVRSHLDPRQARTPHSLGPVLKFARQSADRNATFLAISCTDDLHADGARISGFRLIGPSYGNQSTEEAGIRIDRCIDVEISNMEIAGWGGEGITVADKLQSGDIILPPRITRADQIRIHDNYIHNNQHPQIGGKAAGYGVQTNDGGWAQITRNVFDFNRHAIEASGFAGGYDAVQNLVLKGGGYHGTFFNRYTHIFDVHGTGCALSADLCGDAGTKFSYLSNAFQYRKDIAIKIRGTPKSLATISGDVFPHSRLLSLLFDDSGGAVFAGGPVRANFNHIAFGPNVTGFDSFGQYGVCDFDGDGVDDLFLPTGATWWFSSFGEFHWSFLSAKTERLDKLRFGYFDGDRRCDVLAESSDHRWEISSGGVGAWRALDHFFELPPLSEFAFGRFDPNVRDTRPGVTRRTTHAFHRQSSIGGQWFVVSLSDGLFQPVQNSLKPMNQLRFGDFTGDGVTDVLAVEQGRWAISESARGAWRRLNPTLGDPVAGLFIANMDADDNIDDILRLDRTYLLLSTLTARATLTWWRSKNGVEPWRLWKQHVFTYRTALGGGTLPDPEYVVPFLGFAGRFGTAPGGGTLVIDPTRIGNFYSAAETAVGASPNYKSLFPY